MPYLVAVRNKKTSTITLLDHGKPLLAFPLGHKYPQLVEHEGHYYILTAPTVAQAQFGFMILRPFKGWRLKALKVWLKVASKFSSK
jgi:hypothetical protein